MKDFQSIACVKDNVSAYIDTAYDMGYEDGKKDQEEEDIEKVEQIIKNDNDDKKACKEQAYQKGLDDAWEAVRKMADMDGNTFNEIFGSWLCWTNIFSHESASECLQKIREYEEKQNADDIKIGDEVTYGGMADKDGKVIYTGIITKCDNDNVCVMEKDGKSYEFEKRLILSNTGRHFDQIEQVLEAMKE